MTRTMTVEDSVVIGVDADTLYAQLSDPSRMGRWSPENLGTEVSSGTPAGTPTVGDSFVGRNRRGRFEWVTACTVTAADPGRRFAFRVHGWGLKTPRPLSTFATWEYVLDPDGGGGTRVTERWTDGRTTWPDWLAAAFDRTATGGSLFADFQRRNIARTLANLKADLEPASLTVSPDPVEP